MRELTAEEMELIAGGMGAGSEQDDPWWHDAFSWLSDGLDWIGDIFGGWMNDYLDQWTGLTESMADRGDMYNCWDDYTDYSIDAATNGEDYITNFNDWYDTIDPSTCDVDSAPQHGPNP